MEPTEVISNGGEAVGEKRGRKREREKDEEQYILRLPPVLSKKMRLSLASKVKRDAAGTENTFSVQFISEREAFFYLNDKKYAGTMYDLPTIVETQKTADKRTFYKSGDINQVLIVRLPEITDDAPAQPPTPDPETLIEPYLLHNGISPASKSAAKRFHIPKTSFGAAEVSNVESKIKWVVDNKVTFVKKKPENEKADNDDDLEIEVEDEATSTAASGTSGKTSSTSKSAVTSKPIGAVSKPSGKVEKASSVTVPPKSKPPAVGTASSAVKKVESTPSIPSTPAGGLPSTSNTPLDVANEDDDDDLDDFANMLGDEIMEDKEELKEAERRIEITKLEEDAERRIEITKLDEQIAEHKSKIKAVQDDAAKIPNPVLKRRVLNKIPELETKLKQLEEERKKFD